VAAADATDLGQVTAASDRTAWLLAVYQVANSAGALGNSGCVSNTLLYSTSNAGASWSLLSPP
jgi:hypothetical protein